MVERRAGGRARRLSPPSLPPRWGEGVAPPSTMENSPSDSPHLLVSPDSEYRIRSATLPHLHPTTGAELLEDLHRRLQAQSTAQGSLPRRPKSSSLHRPRRVRRSRAEPGKIGRPAPLLPSSAFNHPSRHTQYSVRQPAAVREATSDYSPSPSTSESPPLGSSLPHPSTSFSYPSPPIQRRQTREPLTSTMVQSPEPTSSSSTASPMAHPTSPASPEISNIPLRSLDSTQYQNFEHGIAYIPSQASSLPIPSAGSTANLSRFNVSPPNAPSTMVRSAPRASSASSSSSHPPILPSSSSHHRPKTKTVSWVSDRKLKAKNISDDRKVVKTQVCQAFSQSYGGGFISEPLLIRPLSSNATSLEVKRHQYLRMKSITFIAHGTGCIETCWGGIFFQVRMFPV